QVSGPVIAVGLVLSAVFVPCAFITGITGQFFRQFALTIAVSTLLSAFNSLTLSPALTALLLRPRDKGIAPPLPVFAFWRIGAAVGVLMAPWLATWVNETFERPYGQRTIQVVGGIVGCLIFGLLGRPANRILGFLFRQFNVAFNWATAGYVRAVARLLRMSLIALLVYGGLLFLTYFSFIYVPKG